LDRQVQLIERKDFYVYEWYNVDTNEVFYVGKGTKNRCHNIYQRNQYFKNYYNKYNCNVRKIKTDLKETEAFELEIKLISEYRAIDQCKCNLADGGEGCTFPEGTWNNMFRKLQYIHDVRGAMDDMDNEEDYDPKNLKHKTLEELKELYQKYLYNKENIKLNKDYYESIDLEPDMLTGFELKTQNEEIVILTELIANNIAAKYKIFNDFLNWKEESDFICVDFNSDKFLKLIFSNLDYYRELIKVTMNVLWFMKQMNYNPQVDVPLEIRSYIIKDNFIHIKFAIINNKKLHRVKIDLFDIVWGILMFKNKPLFQLIYDEIIVAPFI